MTRQKTEGTAIGTCPSKRDVYALVARTHVNPITVVKFGGGERSAHFLSLPKLEEGSKPKKRLSKA